MINILPHIQNMDALREIIASPTRGGFVSVMIHEQYYYKDYCLYLADFETRVLESCRLLSESGYEGRHIIDATDLH